MHIRTIKTVLWFFLGAGLTIILLRILHGPGSVVALSDMIPWGLWKGGGVVALVPIGGAGFTLAAFVYVFHLDRFRPLAIGAVLLGLMCYSSVAIGLMFDIGIWWRIVFPLAFWQFHSTLFEIAWCIMLYLGVLAIEFSHVILKRFNFPRIEKFLHKISIVFVIAGIALSTLHQSSLGTLFLATPYRLHPLWHTDLLPLLFFVTAVGLGCISISWLTVVTHRIYKVEAPMKAISSLVRIGSFVLLAYLLIRTGEIVYAGETALLFATSPDALNFWIEILLSAVIPVALLQKRSFRENPSAVFWIGTVALIGISLNRVNVAGLATVTTTHEFYFPTWTEWSVTLGILAGAALVFLFMVERFAVFDRIEADAVKTAYATVTPDRSISSSLFLHTPRSELKTYSAAFIFAATIAFGLAPEDAVSGVHPEKTRVQSPRIVHAEDEDNLLLIDGNRDGKAVLFDHEKHIRSMGNRKASCVKCHHMRAPGEAVSMCANCHSDMYLQADIFDHEKHMAHLGGNAGCASCHTNPNLPKVRTNTTSCVDCHNDMRPSDTLVHLRGSASSIAPSYMDALHGLCIDCHKKEKKEQEVSRENLDACTTCHQTTTGQARSALSPAR